MNNNTTTGARVLLLFNALPLPPLTKGREGERDGPRAVESENHGSREGGAVEYNDPTKKETAPPPLLPQRPSSPVLGGDSAVAVPVEPQSGCFLVVF